MNQPEIVKYYSRPEVKKAILAVSKNREVVPKYTDRFGRRPNIIQFPKDIEELAKKGATSFHASVELWRNPMELNSDLSRKELNNLRTGWSLILDIDSKVKFEHARVAASVLCEFLMDMGIKPSVKFSGSRGFHIGISEEAFPKKINYKPVAEQYPKLTQGIANYIRERIRDRLLDGLIEEEGGVASLTSYVKDLSTLDPYAFVDIEKNWGSRHLFRAPMSLNEKTWLVSLPIRLFKLKNFKLEDAKVNRFKLSHEFLTNKKEEATELLIQALDWESKHKKLEIPRKKRKFVKSKRLVPEEYFPVCIKQILEGLKDGKKRSLFTLITFLKSVNWDEKQIEKRIKEWNKNNRNPLSDRTVNTQLKWHFRQRRDLLPPNSDSELFYKSIGVEHDEKCGKNPVNDAFRNYKKRI